MGSSLKEYAQVFKELGLTELTVEEGNLRLVLKKDPFGTCKDQKVSEEPYICNESEQEVNGPSGTEVKSPLLGVFYGTVSGKELKVGDEVKEGDTLCSLEAMKMMNDVKAPVSGKIAMVGAKEGDLVEYDQILFVIA